LKLNPTSHHLSTARNLNTPSKEEAEEDEKSPFHEEDANKDPEPEPEAGVGS